MHFERDSFTRWGERYDSCLPVKMVQRMIDPVPGHRDVVPEGSKKWPANAFRKMREAIKEFPLNPHLRASRCDANAMFALGFEHSPERVPQILAAVARGYAWTEFYGSAYLAEGERIKEIHEACETINRALSILAGGKRYLPKTFDDLPHMWANAGPIAQAVKANAGLRIPSKAMFYKNVGIDELLEPIGDGLSALWVMHRALHNRRASLPDRYTHDHLRRFFIICLMEIFVAFTGELPVFETRKENNVDRAWWSFLEATLRFFGFKTTGLRDLLRSLANGGRSVDKRSRAPDAAENALNIPPRLVLDLEQLQENAVARDNTQSTKLNADDFPSSVMMREVADRLRPGTHEAAYSHIALREEDKY